MSADNWGVCPRCKVEFDKNQERLKLEAGAAYGKVTPEEFLRLLDTANEASKIEIQQTFREDYCIGVDSEGNFEVAYRGRCTVCNLEFKFALTKEIPIPAVADSGAARARKAKAAK